MPPGSPYCTIISIEPRQPCAFDPTSVLASAGADEALEEEKVSEAPAVGNAVESTAHEHGGKRHQKEIEQDGGDPRRASDSMATMSSLKERHYSVIRL